MHASSGEPSWRVSASPFRLVFTGPGATVAEATASGAPGGRLGYVTRDGNSHALRGLVASAAVSGGMRYTVRTDELLRTATVTVRRAGAALDVSLALVPAAGVVATYDAFVASTDEHFLGGGQRPGALDLRGQALALKVSHACATAMPAPFFASSAGYGVALRSTAIASFGFPGSTPSAACSGGAEPICPLGVAATAVQICVKAPQLAYRVFFGTPAAVVSGYTKLTGRPQVPPASQLELIKWRDSVAGSGDLLEDVTKLRAAGIPIGWVLLDNPWEQGLCYGNLQFDPTRFPDPAGLLRTLHGEGVRLMLWVSPLLRKQWCSPPSFYETRGVIDGAGSAQTIDLTDAQNLAAFESGLERLLRLGVDGFKGDRGDEFDLEGLSLAGGPGAAVQNTYPLLFEGAVAAAARAAGRSGAIATLFRAASPGSAAVAPGFWGGDQEESYAGLQAAIREGLSAGLAGFSTWGSDTGGYIPGAAPLTPDVFVRWAQFSAVSPIFEVGGAGENATFWDFGRATVARFRAAAILHYELFPYLYGLTRTAHATGIPVLRPLALAYPGDDDAWSHDLEALVGPSLLAAPVTRAGTHADVYLPRGRWTELATGAALAGPRSFDRKAPLGRLPLYLRAGTAIPFAAREPAIWPKAWPVDATTLAGRGGWVYAPGAAATRAADPAYGRFRASAARGSVSLGVSGAPRETQVLVATAKLPRSVKIDGHRVARARTVAGLRAARDGWLPVRTPFRGLVLKLAPVHGASSATLAFGS
ncbi:MAG TPA: TIM-barrel domain-containing protein [Gaiellaceae bacterium]|nr:TIM-barrel domain-containing protein [Gaiellaceae bacterium]